MFLNTFDLDYFSLLNLASTAAIAASDEILKYYHSEYKIIYKNDASPVTIADQEADRIIRTYLEQSNIYVLSEEQPPLDFSLRKDFQALWIVDPLDGTKEFIRKNGEFTVNIALIEDNLPVIGVLLAPAKNVAYIASKELGSFKLSIDDLRYFVKTNDLVFLRQFQLLPISPPSSIKTIVASHTHASKEDFIERMNHYYNYPKILAMGSSLKFGLIAEKKADLYARFNSINEWDTAAGHAVVKFSGGSMLHRDTGEEILYNKQELSQLPFFVKAF